jgi:hypothetical protein
MPRRAPPGAEARIVGHESRRPAPYSTPRRTSDPSQSRCTANVSGGSGDSLIRVFVNAQITTADSTAAAPRRDERVRATRATPPMLSDAEGGYRDRPFVATMSSSVGSLVIERRAPGRATTGRAAMGEEMQEPEGPPVRGEPGFPAIVSPSGSRRPEQPQATVSVSWR